MAAYHTTVVTLWIFSVDSGFCVHRYYVCEIWFFAAAAPTHDWVFTTPPPCPQVSQQISKEKKKLLITIILFLKWDAVGRLKPLHHAAYSHVTPMAVLAQLT